MRTVFEASHVVEAHMVRDLLRQAGIVAHIHGEHLQGAMGELPAAGLVRVVVDEADFARGRAVITQWETEQPRESPPAHATARPRLLLGLAVGAVGGFMLAWAFFHNAVTARGIDYNGDGQPDERWYYNAADAPLRSEADRNFDGRADLVTHFDRHGLPATAESDDNFDGVFEGRLAYRRGNLDTIAVDSDGDGVADLRSRFEHGVQVTAEYLEAPSGRVVRLEHYRMGKLVHAEVDTDRDGQLDADLEYGAFGELRNQRRLPVASPAP